MRSQRGGGVTRICCATALLLVALGPTAAHAILLESKFELFVHDADESIEFYRILGFEVAHAKEGGYTTLAAGPTVVALSPHAWWLPIHWLGFLRFPPLGTELVFYTDSLEATRQRMDDAGHCPTKIKLQPWGDRDFRVRDPDGYYVRITEGTAIPLN